MMRIDRAAAFPAMDQATLLLDPLQVLRMLALVRPGGGAGDGARDAGRIFQRRISCRLVASIDRAISNQAFALS